MYMIGDEVIHNGQTYVSLINYNECALDNYLAWRIRKEEWNCVDPVKNGKWIRVNDDDSLFRCSVCGELSCCASKYCGDCGAKMENNDGRD